MSKRTILVTSALPYANGSLHLGHMVEYIQTDIWVRFQKMRGHQCHYVCADDAHGTAISLYAKKQNIPPETIIAHIHQERIQEFHSFYISFDHYHSTHTPENEKLVTEIYLKLKQKGYIKTKVITQEYDPVAKIFLADRYIKGTCPHCNAEDQYGDNCDKCGGTYDASELKNAKSTLSGAIPVKKNSNHFFFKISEFLTFLKTWVHSEVVPKEVARKLDEWLNSSLKDWDISRDSPYFGIKIPNTSDKFFYVWLDAPIGYMAAFKYLCDHNKTLDFDTFWKENSPYELHHFIGKDIINFHCLFWPAILTGANYRTPTKVHVHGYLTLNKTKMSKSKGSLITVGKYLTLLKPEYLRYYYATKLSGNINDIDFNSEDFITKVNSDLVGKIVNIASRCSGFIKKKFDNILADKLSRSSIILHKQCLNSADTIANCYEQLEYNKAMRIIMKLADQTNTWIDHEKPWIVAKNEEDSKNLHEICTTGINIFRILMVYLKPVIPEIAKQTESFLNIKPLIWEDSQTLLLQHEINSFKTLLSRVDVDAVNKLILPDSQKNKD